MLDKYNSLFLKELNGKASKAELAELKKLEGTIRQRASGEDVSLLINKLDGLRKFVQGSGKAGDR